MMTRLQLLTLGLENLRGVFGTDTEAFNRSIISTAGARRSANARATAASHGGPGGASIPHEQLGTFSGVIVPTLEMGWSVLIFIRFGYIVGGCGVLHTLVLILICAVTVTLTLTSIAAIATNVPSIPRISSPILFILSHSLGSGFAGVITSIYFLGVTSFIAIEIAGSVEGFAQVTGFTITGNDYYDLLIMESITMLFVYVISQLDGRVLHKIAIGIMAALFLSLLSAYVGLFVAPRVNDFDGQVTSISLYTLSSNLWPSEASTLTFDQALSFMIPCFVGIFAGLKNSPMLKNPIQSIPVGGFTSIATSVIMYTSLFVLIASVVKRPLLQENTTVLPDISYPNVHYALPGILLVGVGSALQCFSMSTQILDTLIQRYANLRGKCDASGWFSLSKVATLVLASLILLIPDLEELARVVTLCFLLCYSTTNLAAFLMATFGSPDWRPHYEYHHWSLSLAGFFACLMLMLYLNWFITVLSLFTTITAGLAIHNMSQNASWGTGIQALLYFIAVNHLINRDESEFTAAGVSTAAGRRRSRLASARAGSEGVPHASSQHAGGRITDQVTVTVGGPNSSASSVPKTVTLSSLEPVANIWRPHILSFIHIDPHSHQIQKPHGLSFISQLQEGGGLLCILSNVIIPEEIVGYQPFEERDISGSLPVSGDLLEKIAEERKRLIRNEMASVIENHINPLSSVRLIYTTLYSSSISAGQSALMQTAGLGHLSPNLIMLVNVDEKIQAVRDIYKVWEFGNLSRIGVIVQKGLDTFPSNDQVMTGNIDIWWVVHDGYLMILLSYILQRSQVWRNCSIRLFAITDDANTLKEMAGHIGDFLLRKRIKVQQLSVISLDDDEMDTGPQVVDEHAFSAYMERGNEELTRIREYIGENLSEASAPTRARDRTSSHDSRGDIFSKAQAAVQLKKQLTFHSSGGNADLVMLNLPSPEFCDTFHHKASSAPQNSQLYCDLIEFLTDKMRRVILVNPAGIERGGEQPLQ
ncbi:hypothetical protein HDU76_008124 [Blyttiomyces sp. JEL0837]|nr:hypothetical protein HDU76_008124 [Blyttiomyces sp. JEL0837]